VIFDIYIYSFTRHFYIFLSQQLQGSLCGLLHGSSQGQGAQGTHALALAAEALAGATPQVDLLADIWGCNGDFMGFNGDVMVISWDLMVM